MYGAPICQGCVKAKAAIEERADIELDYRNITESTGLLKEFLNYRDHDDLFEEMVEAGRIGIPFFILEDGTKTFDLETVLQTDQGKIKVVVPDEVVNEPLVGNACSVDGTGKC